MLKFSNKIDFFILSISESSRNKLRKKLYK